MADKTLAELLKGGAVAAGPKTYSGQYDFKRLMADERTFTINDVDTGMDESGDYMTARITFDSDGSKAFLKFRANPMRDRILRDIQHACEDGSVKGCRIVMLDSKPDFELYGIGAA